MQPQMMMYTPPASNYGNFDPSARFGKGASYNIPVSNFFANNKSILSCNTFLLSLSSFNIKRIDLFYTVLFSYLVMLFDLMFSINKLLKDQLSYWERDLFNSIKECVMGELIVPISSFNWLFANLYLIV